MEMNGQKETPRIVAEAAGLEAYNIGKQIKRRSVLRNVSVNVKRGEAVGLLGPNGAGKTTFFYILTGLVAADYGTVKINNADVTNLPMYRRARLGLGYLPQETSIFRGLSVEQNIMAVLEVVESIPARRSIILEELLVEFSLSHLRQAPALGRPPRPGRRHSSTSRARQERLN